MRGITTILAVAFASATCAYARPNALRQGWTENFLQSMWEKKLGVSMKELSPAAQIVHQATTEVIYSLANARPKEHWNLIKEDRDSRWCPENSYFEFIPTTVASVKPETAPSTWTGSCFNSMSATLSNPIDNKRTMTLKLSGASSTSSLCSDLYTIATSYGIVGVVDLSVLAPNQTVEITPKDNYEFLDILRNGVHVMVWPCGVIGTVESALKTAGLFIGDGEQLIQHNLDFLTYKKIYPSPMVSFNKTTPVSKSSIRSGDYLAIARFDGLDPMVMYGTGGRTGHSALAVWDGDELYVCESTAANPFGKVYWPPPYGIIRTPWDRWVQLADEAHYHVDILPLAPKYSQAFDENAYWSWFKTIEGMPYGFHNMLYSFLDTHDPAQNLPAPSDNWVLLTILNLWGELVKNGDPSISVQSLFIDALNHRSKESCTDMTCVSNYLVMHNISLAELTSQPELDEWKYDNGQNYSMVCSVFAAHGWKVGLASSLPVYQAAEQTPKDNYQMNIFDGNYFDESNCPNGGLWTTDQGTYCQLMGPYRMVLNGYNTIPPYEGMNNFCPSQWPDYFRCPANNIQCC